MPFDRYSIGSDVCRDEGDFPESSFCCSEGRRKLVCRMVKMLTNPWLKKLYISEEYCDDDCPEDSEVFAMTIGLNISLLMFFLKRLPAIVD